MPQYAAPGVYVEEVSSGAKPIAGAGTSTAGFVGLVKDDVDTQIRPGVNPLKTPASHPDAFEQDNDRVRLKANISPRKTRTSDPNDFYPLADAGKAYLITNWESFTRSFGDIQPGNHTLAHAVYGFFNNGGTRCWVVRAANNTQAGSDAALIAALDALRQIDEVALVAIPGATSSAVHNAILDHCEREELQDRFAILDGIPAQADGKPLDVLTRETIQGTTRDSSYGAIYFPWIEVFDPPTGKQVIVPPSGHIAGVFARVDSTRGVHKAPANEVIRGALGVSTLVGKADHAGLNVEDINVIRQFGGNITVFGARTLAGKENAEWKYVNVRRLFLFLRESIDEGTQWVVFEPNDAALWGKIRRNISAFLTNVWRSGALFGATPEEAFYVRCDETTNTDDSRKLGLVVTEVGVAVVEPAEFVVFRISQWSGPSA
ncbi:MAG: phage tail sheath family protein [Chloroflexales bacterium]|nr:phage tail sheath family protein [Chloroflexales bacterium]